MKHPNKPLHELVSLGFHGTSATDPIMIATSEVGLDKKFCNPKCLYGPGIYFSNNSEYSHKYSHKKGNVNSMLFCYVITGESFPTTAL